MFNAVFDRSTLGAPGWTASYTRLADCFLPDFRPVFDRVFTAPRSRRQVVRQTLTRVFPVGLQVNQTQADNGF